MMNTLQALLNSALIHCLGWTLVHFIWQGIAVGTLYIGIRQLLIGKSSAARYYAAMIALATMAILPVFTFYHLIHENAGINGNQSLPALTSVYTPGGQQNPPAPLSIMDTLQTWLQPLIPWAVLLWLLGVFAATLRVLRGWQHAYQLRETAAFIPLQKWHSVAESLCSALGIHKLVRLAVSSRISVPSVIGWLKPIILIPPSSLAGLTALQMELILAHELAHIRRQDYLWNLLQVAVETLLFYHPVVRWVSHQARLEREQCCDDMVVELHGNAVEYARALTELESLRNSRNALLLGANGGQVLNRIHRLLGLSAPSTPAFWLPLILIVGLIFTTSVVQFAPPKMLLQGVLTAKYAMLGNIRQEAAPASVKSGAQGISPTRIDANTWAKPVVAKPVTVGDGFLSVSSFAIPQLATALRHSIAPVDTPAPDKRDLAVRNVIAGSIIAKHLPVYPSFALERGVEGSATVEFILTAEGDITDMHVTNVRGSRLFGQAAMDALREWKFRPATIAGTPVAQRMVEEFVFRLKDQSMNGGICKIPMGYHVCSAN
jgi:bla regulator protein blaR1